MFDGYRVLDLGTWVLVPAAATVLADFGARSSSTRPSRRSAPRPSPAPTPRRCSSRSATTGRTSPATRSRGDRL